MKTAWIDHKSDNGEKMALFCFPHAGGTASYFAKWGKKLPGTALMPVQFPMREKRIKEPMPDSIQALVAAFVDECVDLLRERPFAFFGHCSGSIAAYEAAKYAKETYNIEPKLLFVSSCYSPADYSAPVLSTLGNEDLLKEIEKTGFVTKELLANPFMFEYFAPIVKKDFALQENYRCSGADPVSAPIVALYGTDDQTMEKRELIQNWERFTTAGLSIESFRGTHIYLEQETDTVLETISKYIKEYMANES